MTKQREDFYTIYVNVNQYYREYFTKFYGGSPICFPESSEIYATICENLIPNPKLALITKDCFCEYAWNLNDVQSVSDGGFVLPDEENKKEFLAIAIPPVIHRNGKEIQTNKLWQLSKKGTVHLRRMLRDEFWLSLTHYINLWNVKARASGTPEVLEDAVENFMIKYEMDMQPFYNLLREERRQRKRLYGQVVNINNFIKK